VALAAGEYDPRLQNSHITLPNPDEKLPAEHVKHVVVLTVGEYDPAPHNVHSNNPDPEE
jgi:hypothetical protein